MSADEDERSPFTRPGFIASALVVALVVVLGIVIAIVNATRNDDPGATATAGSSTSSAAATTATAAAESASVCGLAGEVLTGTLTTAPEATWEYEGTTAYPTSATYGPGKTDPAGFRYCYQHSPTGALFMAANAVALGSDESVKAAWGDYVLGAGKFHEQLLAQKGSTTTTAGTRIAIGGFRILNYTGESASVDLALTYSSATGNVTVSGVYALVWQDGDWKLSADTMTPLDVAPIPNVAGYIAWGK